MVIVEERSGDEAAIRRVVMDAFGRGDEARLVDQLRLDGSLAVSLLAEQRGTVCGHVALSRMNAPPRALALAPVSVATDKQGLGIGSALIRRAVELARGRGYALIFVLGSAGYYERFGFTAAGAAPFHCRYAGPHFMALNLTTAAVAPQTVVYAKAFDSLG